jgi:hypothetical protein
VSGGAGAVLAPVRVAVRWVGFAVLSLGVLMSSGRVRLVVAFALFAGWMGWLTYTTLEKSRAPIVSRAQAAAAPNPVWAEVAAGPDGRPLPKAKVDAPLTDRGPPAGSEIEVANLPDVQGFTGPGKYLLLLTPDRTPGRFRVADEFQRSPGYDLSGRPVIYPWSQGVEAGAKALFR